MTDTADRCPKCGAADAWADLKLAPSGRYDCDSPKDGSFQSDRCRIAELEREVERLKAELSQIYAEYNRVIVQLLPARKGY